MKRRGFVRGMLLAPAAQAALSAQQPPATPAAATQGRGGGGRGGAQNIPLLKVSNPDESAATTQRYFSKDQFETLEKLGSIFMPPLKGNPSALDAQAPVFLDFLISVSPAKRQNLYKSGLDQLNAQAKQKFSKSFSQLDAAQAAAILKPLMVVRVWTEDWPADSLKNFVAEAHEDLRKATTNSREWAEAAAKSGRRFNRGSQATGYYWKPIDPIVGE